VYPDRAPYEDGELFALESSGADRQPLVVGPGDDVIPPKGPDFLGAKADSQAHHDVGVHQRAWARFLRAEAGMDRPGRAVL
jgi:hypothetical protein